MLTFRTGYKRDGGWPGGICTVNTGGCSVNLVKFRWHQEWNCAAPTIANPLALFPSLLPSNPTEYTSSGLTEENFTSSNSLDFPTAHKNLFVKRGKGFVDKRRSLPLGSFGLAGTLGIGPTSNSLMRDFALCSPLLTHLTHTKNPTALSTVLVFQNLLSWPESFSQSSKPPSLPSQTQEF